MHRQMTPNQTKETLNFSLWIISATLTRPDVLSIFMNLNSVEKNVRRNISRNKKEIPLGKK